MSEIVIDTEKIVEALRRVFPANSIKSMYRALLTPKQAAAYLGYDVKQLAVFESEGLGYVVIEDSKRYPRMELDRFIDERIVRKGV